ncbi:Acg family FMN-binding oxidoreductase [Nocardia carnea]|uniref:Acg family FMN-binding oxidoreductase n=1 Tax=Nocardia carnea TaxID=37328 RepID=UPI002456DA35|nr:NAD(P)H nitroreductase [Nocardia carnea]
MNEGPAGAVVERAVHSAGRAPSLHNSQPWRWTLDGDTLSLYAVPERMLPTTDTGGRQMLISCGAALDHLRVAMAAAGWKLSVERFPDPNNRDHLADIGFRRAAIVTEGDRARAEAIGRRYTDRLPFGAPAGWTDFETILRSTFDPADAVVDVLPEDSRPALAHAAQMTSSLRRYDSGYHAELHWWTGHVISATGVPRSALVSPGEQEQVAVGRRFPARSGESDRSVEVADDHAAILVLSTAGDTPEEIVRCGEVLSTVLLESTLAGYATCPLTNLTEMARSREAVRELIGGRRQPQVLIRVGALPHREQPPAPTPRLPLPEILSIVDAPTSRGSAATGRSAPDEPK